MLHGGHPSRKRSGDCLKGKGCNAPCGRHCKRKDMIEAENRWGESPSLRENREKVDHGRRGKSSWRKSVELCSLGFRAAGALSVVLYGRSVR